MNETQLNLWTRLDRAIARRQRTTAEQREATTECRRAVVELLRAGTKPTDLYGRPYSPAYVSLIQSEEGLTRAASKRVKQDDA
jgi:hypothetical protein